MRRERGLLIKTISIGMLALAPASTAGCDPAGKPASAAAGPSTGPTASADSKFGTIPTKPPTATPTTKPPAATPPAKPQTVKTPSRPRTDWVKLVKKCPHPGQKVEIQKVKTADVTGDGTDDTLVTRGCEASTSYWPSTIEVFDGDSRKRLGTLLEGDVEEPVVTGVTVAEGVVTVKAYGTTLKGTKACPDLALTYRYEYAGDGFKRLSREAVAKKRC